MKAWRIEKHGGPEVLQSIEIPSRKPGPLEVRVRVQAVGLNHLDLWVQKGVPGHHFPLPLIPGCDITGVVEEFGPGSEAALKSSQIEKGTPVVLNPGVSCGHCEACLGGFDPLCRFYGILGETQDGGCAEEIIVPLANLIRRPPTLTPEQAACLPIPYLTAWTMLVRKAQIRPGDFILIQAGGSGVSVAAIQIAKLFGATVITTVGSDEKIPLAQTLGADFVIPYKKVPFRNEVRKILSQFGKKGCDVVLDHVGADTFQESLKSLTRGGKLVTCGATSGAQIEIDLKQVFFKNISILGSTMGSKSDLIRIVDLVATGKLKTVIDSVFPISDLPQAYQKLESRQVFGKVVLRAN